MSNPSPDSPKNSNLSQNEVPEKISGNAGDLHLTLPAGLFNTGNQTAADLPQSGQPAAATSARNTVASQPPAAPVDPIALQGWSGNAPSKPRNPAPPAAGHGTVAPTEAAGDAIAAPPLPNTPAATSSSPFHNPAPQTDVRSGDAAPRTGTILRNTTETKITLRLNLDGQGKYTVSTGIRFFDHMLELFARHGAFDLELDCNGDLDVDQHHTVEDVGIALGEAVDQALGDKKGILRAGYFIMPMDETLAVASIDFEDSARNTNADDNRPAAIAAIDLSGRTAYAVDTQVTVPIVGDLQTELLTDFFEGFARGARCNVHVKTLYGRSNHHKIEAIFKAFARALRGATSRDQRMKDLLPSTKGLL